MRRGDTDDIWIWDDLNKNIRRLTFNESSSFPLWTIDGQRIAFTMDNEDGRGIYWRAVNGMGGDDLIAMGSGAGFWPSAWSVDGKTLVTTEFMAGSGLNIGSISMEEDHSHKPLLQKEYGELQPQISPDGKWMAYTSSESGEEEIYVRPFPDVDEGQWQVSKDGGTSPLWSHDGEELFYRKGDEVIAVSVETEPTFNTVKSETLFRGNYVYISAPDFHPWDIHPDGKRFLMIKDSLDDTSTEGGLKPGINIILNWFEDLKQKVPVP